MNIYAIHASSLLDIQTELGGDCPSFTWNKKAWACLPGGAKAGRNNGIGGFSLTSDLQLTCLTGQFGSTIPDAGETINYNGRAFTIKEVTPAPTGKQMRINADLNVTGM